MKKRTGEPWMNADDFGRSLSGFSLNLLVPEIQPSLVFAEKVLLAKVVYNDPDFAVVTLSENGLLWMLHADHTYNDHPMRGVVEDQSIRGAGLELRVHNTDPDAAEQRARQHDYVVLDGSTDKVHGLREVFIADPAGYIWVLDRPLAAS